MKKFIAALLAGLTLFTLVGCSGGSKADSSTPKDYSQIIHDARSDEDNEYDMIFTKGEDGKFTAIDGYSAEYKADQLNEEIRDILMPPLNLEDGQYTAFAASISSMMVRSYAVAIVKPAEGKTDEVKAALEAYVASELDSPWSIIWRISISWLRLHRHRAPTARCSGLRTEDHVHYSGQHRSRSRKIIFPHKPRPLQYVSSATAGVGFYAYSRSSLFFISQLVRTK